MNKQRWFAVALGVVVFLVFILWAKSLRSAGRVRTQEKEAAGAAALQASGAETAARRAVVSKYKEWGDDPFRVKKPTEEPIAFFSLEGIVMDPTAPFAIINGEIRKEGETVGGAVVAKIEKSRVILKKGSKEITLDLFQE